MPSIRRRLGVGKYFCCVRKNHFPVVDRPEISRRMNTSKNIIDEWKSLIRHAGRLVQADVTTQKAKSPIS